MQLSSDKVIVFDVDDTILKTEDRDYENSIPIHQVIEGIRQLKKNGWKIVLHTSRGMGRSNGDIESVSDQVKTEIENFCFRYNVPFDELILGKVWATAYVDDKAMRPDEFAETYSKFLN